MTTFSRYLFGLLLMGFFLGGSANAVEAKLENLSVSGHYLGAFSSLHQSSFDRSQFDFAANLDFEYEISDKIKGLIQLQGGPGKGSIGFGGPEVAITDLNIEAHCDKSGGVYTIGSYDLPFGQETQYLVNNADATSSKFLVNSLFYSAIGGNVGTLNTVGVKGVFERKYADVIFSLSNGTSENAFQGGNALGALLGIGSRALHKDLYVSGTYFYSDDQDDAGNANSDSFETVFSGWMLDAAWDITKAVRVKGYVGSVSYDDDNAATKDDVAFYAIEGSYDTGSWFAAGRVSAWNPEDADGNKSGISSSIPNPGLSQAAGTFSPATDTDVIRYQVGVGRPITDGLVARADLILDDYDTGETTKGLLLYLNGSF